MKTKAPLRFVVMANRIPGDDAGTTFKADRWRLQLECRHVVFVPVKKLVPPEQVRCLKCTGRLGQY